MVGEIDDEEDVVLSKQGNYEYILNDIVYINKGCIMKRHHIMYIHRILHICTYD